MVRWTYKFRVRGVWVSVRRATVQYHHSSNWLLFHFGCCNVYSISMASVLCMFDALSMARMFLHYVECNGPFFTLILSVCHRFVCSWHWLFVSWTMHNYVSYCLMSWFKFSSFMWQIQWWIVVNNNLHDHNKKMWQQVNGLALNSTHANSIATVI